MKLAIVGSKEFSNYSTLIRVINQIKLKANYKIEEIVTQGEKSKDPQDPSYYYGIGEFAKKYAKTMLFPYKIFHIEWEDKDGNYNKDAAFERNEIMIEYADVFAVFHDEDSHSLALIEQIKKSGKNYYDFNFKKAKIEI